MPSFNPDTIVSAIAADTEEVTGSRWVRDGGNAARYLSRNFPGIVVLQSEGAGGGRGQPVADLFGMGFVSGERTDIGIQVKTCIPGGSWEAVNGESTVHMTVGTPGHMLSVLRGLQAGAPLFVLLLWESPRERQPWRYTWIRPADIWAGLPEETRAAMVAAVSDDTMSHTDIKGGMLSLSIQLRKSGHRNPDNVPGNGFIPRESGRTPTGGEYCRGYCGCISYARKRGGGWVSPPPCGYQRYWRLSIHRKAIAEMGLDGPIIASRDLPLIPERF